MSTAAHSLCPACDGPQSVEWGKDQGKTILECTKCNSIYFSRPIRSSHDYDTYYPYLAEFNHERFAWEFEQRRRSTLAKLKVVRKYCSNGQTLLDFGAGPGYFCAHAAMIGWTSLAIESSIPARNAGTEHFSVQYRNIDQIVDGTMDAVTCFHVLEHVEDPQGLITRLARKLSMGGALFVHVPNKESLTSWVATSIRRVLDQRYERRGCLYFDEHLTGFTPDGLARCAAGAGLNVVWHKQVSFFHDQYDPALWKLRFSHGWFKGAIFLLKAVFKGTLDTLGGLIGRGDWIAMCFIKVSDQNAEPIADQIN